MLLWCSTLSCTPVLYLMTLSSRFGRILSQGRGYIPEVDGLRFLAIAAVVLFHLRADVQHYTLVLPRAQGLQPVLTGLEDALLRLFGLGYFGVELFFVLSGFLLALPFAKWRLGLGPRPALGPYYKRRLTRLEPPYVVAMLGLFAVAIGIAAVSLALAQAGIRPTTRTALPDQFPNLLASLVYQHNLLFGEPSVVNRVAWSLEIEVQFYVLAPLLASVFSVRNRWSRRLLVLAIVVGAPLARGLAPPDVARVLSLSLPGFVEYFFAGFLLADLFLVDWREAPSVSRRWDLASLIAWPGLAVLVASHRAEPLLAPAILLAYVGAFRGRWSRWVFTLRGVTMIGGMCYSMYLLHYFVITLTGILAQSLHLGSTFLARLVIEGAIALPLVLAVTCLYFIWLERPCMDPRWPGRAIAWFGQLKRPVPPPEVQS